MPKVGEFWSLRGKVINVRVTDGATWYTVRFRGSEKSIELRERDFLEITSQPELDWKSVPFGTFIEVRQTDEDYWVPAMFISFDSRTNELWAYRSGREVPRVFSQYRLQEV